MDRWGNLNMQQKAQLLGIYASKGYTDLASIINHYNTFQAGGYIKKEDPVLKDRRPKANFYQRLLDSNRQTIPDWEYKGNVATHKMSYVTNEDNTKAVVYPEVQEINGKLYDFTDPKNKAGKWDALNRAIETGDTIQMTPTQANFWTQHYKEFYPSFNYAEGGSLGHITPYGQWEYPHQVTTIPSNNITMKGVDYPVLGISDTGDTKYMLPNMDYLFDGNYVTEYPLHKFQRGGYITNGRTLADGRTVYPISDLPADDTPTSLPAAKINLKPVTVTAKHPYHDIWGEETSVPADLNTPKKWQDYKNFVTRVQERPDYKGVQTFMNIAALSPLLPILGPEALSFGKEALLGTVRTYAKPMATAMFGLAGYEGLNNLSLEGTGNTFDYNLARNIVHSEPTSGDILAASFLNPGLYLGGAESKISNYTSGVNKRLAEVGLRMGDKLMHMSFKGVPKFLKDNNMRNITSYIFNPKADPKLAYNLGPDFMYNGTEAGSSTTGGYEGDVIDLYLGKNLDKAPYELTNNYPEAISKYTTEKYGIKRPRVYDIGVVDNKANRAQSEAMGIYQYDHPVLDPGGHVTYGENDLGTLHYDIWKYNPKEFIQRWGKKEGMSRTKKLLARAAASFIDKRGEPIAHIWTQPWEGTVTTDSHLMGISDKLGFQLSDKDLNYILQMPFK